MKTPIPDTRNSLILRLADRGDAEAWDQFVSIYEPLVFRLARSKGFQDADAREISQEVLIAVSKAVQRWQPDEELGRFRDWLFRIARNLMINFMTRRHRQSIASGHSRVNELLELQIDPHSDEAAEFDLEYRRDVFRWAAEQVQSQVKEATWQAFWMTSTDQKSVAEVASQLGLSVGAVHIAKEGTGKRSVTRYGGRTGSGFPIGHDGPVRIPSGATATNQYYPAIRSVPPITDGGQPAGTTKTGR